MRVNERTFVIADWHFGHKSVAKFANRPEKHEELIIERCNHVVGKYNTLLFLGDFTFVNKEKTAFFTDRIRCQNKMMVFGNHDNRTDSFYEDLGFKTIPPVFRRITVGGSSVPVILTHEPVIDLPDSFINIHGHIHRGTHREFNLTPNHINVSCEVLDFFPVTIGYLLEEYVYGTHIS